MEFVKKTIKYIGLVGCIVVVLATFLPFVKVTVSLFGYSSSQSVKFVDGDGVIVIVLAIIAGAMIFGKTMKNLKIFNINLEKLLRFWWGPLVPIGLATLITVYDAINVNDVAGTYGSYATISFGIGFYLILLGLIVSIASILYEKFVMKVDTKVAAESPVTSSTTTYVESVQQSSIPVQPVVEPVVTTSSVVAQEQPVQQSAIPVQPAVEPVVTASSVVAQEQSVQQTTTPIQSVEPQPSVIICPGCGSQVPSTSKFCTICGKQLQ